MDADTVAGAVSGPVRVAIVDDHPVVVEGIRSWLAVEPRLTVVATGDDPDVVLRDAPDADVVLLDLRLHGRMAVDSVAGLSAAGRRVVVYSEHTEPETMLAVLDAGAVAFLAKHEGREHCVATVLAAASDRAYVPPTLAGAMVGDARPDRPALSDKEREALLLWFQSMSKASVARRMRISEHTVKQYVDRARIKYTRAGRPAATKAALLARAIEDGLIRPEEIGVYQSYASSDRPTP
ncbi:DNA-binding response regulator, NarL/FixJ family, contains REC and HTH domains [Micromonospora pallida]|uniref:DNA-binding response regulator, NarL/FixJ family, contains REC and HTH domains n=1 Tax=Micromonospora pallida TaxID=145854 RepID=A0A1C6TJD3_9ACTN|nr:response regulator transcription factor [Micromonospora pallida]SCL41655.1 DNA-binding response regulator, NarL/FixJ family, contains REC and HTH domains [Micromonospora pallida]